MKSKYLNYLFPLLALAVGYFSAFATYYLSILFVLLPIWAFVFGYFSSWRSGLLKGFLLLVGYTLATQIMSRGTVNLFYLSPYFYNFVFGGFTICIIGGLAPLARRGIRRIASIAIVVAVTGVVLWCGYLALPSYSYYYQIIINSSEYLEDLEIYLPIAYLSESPYLELYDNIWEQPSLTSNFTKEIVNTEYGQMLKLTVPYFMDSRNPDYPYVVNIIFWVRDDAPHQFVKLMPKYDVTFVNDMDSNSLGLMAPGMRQFKTIELFKVPILIKTITEADIKIRLENRTGYGENINFQYGKSKAYTELSRVYTVTDGEWLLAPVEATFAMSIRGVSD